MRFIKNIVLLISSILLTILFIQIFFHLNVLKIIDQNKISRNIIFNLDYYFFTFYPSTHNKSLESYTAVIGDSYAVGQGDSFLKNEKNYSSVHIMNKDKYENYLNFAKPGARSITSIREFLFRYNIIKESYFLPDISEPNKFIIFFYAGNDIIDNVQYFKIYNQEFSIKDYVSNSLEDFSNFSTRKFNIYFPIFSFSKNIVMQNFIDYIYLPYLRGLIKSDTIKNINVPLNKVELLTNKILYEGELEQNNPGYLLSNKELDLGINIFFYSVNYLRKKFPNVEIEIVYIPSPACIYNWVNDKVLILNNQKEYSFTKKFMDDRHNYIIKKFKKYAENKNIDFINTTPSLKKYANNTFLHGQLDPNHFNKLGYKILADTIIK